MTWNTNYNLPQLNEEQRLKVLRQLVTWFEEHPNSTTAKVPEVCVFLLDKMTTSNAVTSVTMSRVASFRNSLRRFSILRNKVSPSNINLPANTRDLRSVTFNDKPTVYSITYWIMVTVMSLTICYNLTTLNTEIKIWTRCHYIGTNITKFYYKQINCFIL